MQLMSGDWAALAATLIALNIADKGDTAAVTVILASEIIHAKTTIAANKCYWVWVPFYAAGLALLLSNNPALQYTTLLADTTHGTYSC